MGQLAAWAQAVHYIRGVEPRQGVLGLWGMGAWVLRGNRMVGGLQGDPSWPAPSSLQGGLGNGPVAARARLTGDAQAGVE